MASSESGEVKAKEAGETRSAERRIERNERMAMETPNN
jgi:hypothetical protein